MRGAVDKGAMESFSFRRNGTNRSAPRNRRTPLFTRQFEEVIRYSYRRSSSRWRSNARWSKVASTPEDAIDRPCCCILPRLDWVGLACWPCADARSEARSVGWWLKYGDPLARA